MHDFDFSDFRNKLWFESDLGDYLAAILTAVTNNGFLKKLVEIRYLTNVPAKADC